MKQVNDLWVSRLSDYQKELQKYMRYIFNGHLMFVLIFAVGGGGYVYSNWIQTLDETFPSAILIAAVIGIALTMSPVYTYLQEPDKVYLTPLEGQMKRYFINALVSSFFFQSYVILLLLAAAMPLYVQTTGAQFTDFFWFLAIVLAVKIWNLIMRWTVLRYQEPANHYMDLGIRLVLNIVFLWTVFADTQLWLPIAVGLLMAGYMAAFRQLTKEKSLKWELLIDLENARLHRFYRFANLFTDVPHLKGQAKRRKWMDPFLKTPDLNPVHTYSYLYTRTFLRSDEYFGLWVRLTIIAGVIISGADNLWLKVITAVLFLYLTGFQLIPLLKKHELKIWPDLYPVNPGLRHDSFKKLLMKILVVQAVVFALISLVQLDFYGAAMIAAVSIVFVIVFSSMYVPAQIKKHHIK
ncbi:ABC transporter permease [Jeotgalibacillus terrae]|uniref:ABC transporter permease n=1 Tax=Jeotgalibacillus terrae TaxID=587735 RepID=A0ABW5ZEW5_9BACL|nr:ABC transporter permease [Jeotgalibacillus terrae]MBM7579820.1 ABC-2 type transport system permease protein [Jeotgalibacillus terrae]